MIKINLLLVREARHKENLRQQLVILVLFLAGMVLLMGCVQWYLVRQIHRTGEAIVRSEGEIKQLKVKIGQIEHIKKLQEEVRKKLEILRQLRAARNGPVKRLAALSDALPDKVWLTRYSETGDTVSMAGVAATEELIAEFMGRLEQSRQFHQIELQVSEQTELSGIKVKRFDLACRLGAPRKEAPKEIPKEGAKGAPAR